MWPSSILTVRLRPCCGIGGRKIALLSEDSETNPDAGVRAARKLIDVDRVSAIIGTWASAVTTAVAPLAWQSKTMLFTVSGADSITKLPHQGYIIRTQPNTELQSGRAAEYLAKAAAKRVFALSAQTPFAVDSYRRLAEVLKQNGSEAVGDVVYDAAKTSFPVRDRPGLARQAGHVVPQRLHARRHHHHARTLPGGL